MRGGKRCDEVAVDLRKHSKRFPSLTFSFINDKVTDEGSSANIFVAQLLVDSIFPAPSEARLAPNVKNLVKVTKSPVPT